MPTAECFPGGAARERGIFLEARRCAWSGDLLNTGAAVFFLTPTLLKPNKRSALPTSANITTSLPIRSRYRARGFVTALVSFLVFLLVFSVVFLWCFRRFFVFCCFLGVGVLRYFCVFWCFRRFDVFGVFLRFWCFGGVFLVFPGVFLVFWCCFFCVLMFFFGAPTPVGKTKWKPRIG